MQWVKANAATVRVEDRVCNEVIKIDEHGQQHDAQAFFHPDLKKTTRQLRGTAR